MKETRDNRSLLTQSGVLIGQMDADAPGSDVTTGTRRITASFAKLYPPDGEGKIWWGRLKKALVTQEPPERVHDSCPV